MPDGRLLRGRVGAGAGFGLGGGRARVVSSGFPLPGRNLVTRLLRHSLRTRTGTTNNPAHNLQKLEGSWVALSTSRTK